ncbi:MAG TPA: hypothetical protein VF868_15480 [Bacteroidia bacterium]|jgi:hypothetical protein
MADNNLKKKAAQSSRYPFIAEHRGGPLKKEEHRKLMGWAIECAEHVLPLIDTEADNRLIYALEVAKEWENDKISTGIAMKASSGAHEAARVAEDQVSKAIARAIGQAVATAHMADHSLGAAFYALKAVKLANKNTAKEKEWQTEKLNRLPSHLTAMVKAGWKKKELDRRI